jgi:cation:H+ antiporter
MSLIFWIGIFVISLVVLVKSADYFTSCSEKLGLALRIPAFIVGIIIVSVGTSMPELVSSIIAVWRGVTDIVAADVIGSNIFNILFIVGVAALIARKIEVERDLIDVDLPLLASFAGLLVITCLDGKFTLIEGVISIFAFLIYIHYSIISRERGIEKLPKGGKVTLNLIFGLVASAFFLYLGARYTIEGVVKISEIARIGTSIISLTAVAIGTSLPELAVSVRAAMQKKFEISLGNIIGSNIFNGSLIMGVSALIKPLEVSSTTVAIGIPFLILTTVLMVFSGISRRIYLWEGALFFLIYIIFIAKLFNLF